MSVTIDNLRIFFASKEINAGFYVVRMSESENLLVDPTNQFINFINSSELNVRYHQPNSETQQTEVTTWWTTDEDNLEAVTTVSRAVNLSQDFRLSISNLKKHAKPDDVLVLLSYEGELFILNASRLDIESLSLKKNSPVSEIIGLLAKEQHYVLEDRFCEWNKRLLESFFSEASQGEEVFMRTDPEFLDGLGQDIGGDAGFIEAVKKGPSWLGTNLGLVRKICSLVQERIQPERGYIDPEEYSETYRNLRAPAYLPYLAALVRNACEHQSFYEGLKNELQLENEFGSQEMQRIEVAWKDLQDWTSNNNGRFGFFNFRVLGGHRLIGVPRSQAILKHNDLEALSISFIQAQIGSGLELTQERLGRIINSIKASTNLYSAGFMDAIRQEDLLPPIHAIIQAVYADWDGKLTPRKNRDLEKKSSSQDSSVVSICLVFDGSSNALLPAWKIFTNFTDGSLSISYEDIRWNTVVSGSQFQILISKTEGQRNQLWRLLQIGAEQEVNLKYDFLDEHENIIKSSTFESPSSPLWIFVPKSNPISRDIELHAGELPATGQVFLLASPEGVEKLKFYLKSMTPLHQVITDTGIPQSWMLIRIDHCEDLTDEQRNIPYGRVNSARPRVIRFEGGRSIRRGYNKMYLPYDLPTIELDAPAEVHLKPIEGITLIQLINKQGKTAGGLFHLKPQKSFSIELENSASGSYEIAALDKSNNVIGTARLRISGLGGEVVEHASNLHINRFGRAVNSQYGLKGPNLNDPLVTKDFSINSLSILNKEESTLGKEAGVANKSPKPTELFLDSLAQSGTLSYDVARDQMLRFLADAKLNENPIKLIIELQKLGHLELSRTDKGHIAKVHALPPSVYSLPQKHERNSVWAIAGTLRLAHWAELEKKRSSWITYLNSVNSDIRNLILVVHDIAQAKIDIRALGFLFSCLPCDALIKWAANLNEFTVESFRFPMESIGRAQDSIMRFNPERGNFFSGDSAGYYCELWRVKDRDTGVDNVHVLAKNGSYTFIRDREWGIWVALQEFTQWAATTHNIPNLLPLITYQESRHTLWIPERIRPPFILDRTLYLCAGRQPDVYSVKAGERHGNRLQILELSTEICLVTVDSFYLQMAQGKWLAYRMVPLEIATELAIKLGARLDIV